MAVKLPSYYQLDDQVAKIEPTEDGGASVTVPINKSIADFLLYGSVISKTAYEEKLKKNSKNSSE